MKIISYSDLHLEFPHKWNLPPDIDGDILVLAGDIITFKDFAPLAALLQGWEKPALFVAGNHEYYTRSPMQDDEKWFKSWLSKEFPNVYFLCNEGVVIYGVNFFGGTMWTNFKFSNKASMRYAAKGLNDFRYIPHGREIAVYIQGTVPPLFPLHHRHLLSGSIQSLFHDQRRGKRRELGLRFHAAQVFQFLTVLVGLFLFALHHNQRFALPRIARFRLRLSNGRGANGRHQSEAAAFAHEQEAFLFLESTLGVAACSSPWLCSKFTL